MTDPAPLPRRPFGNTGAEVPALGYGSVPIGRPGYAEADAHRLLDGLLGRGIDLLDTAAAYGRAEEAIGRWLPARRDRVFLVTKAGQGEGWRPQWSAPEILASVERSLRRLRTDRVDLLLLHSCDLETLRRGEVLEALLAAKRAGKARFVGYSGDNAALRHAVERDDLDAVETSFSLLDQANTDTIRRAAERGLGVLLKRSIANAVVGRTSAPDDAYAAPYYERWRTLGFESVDAGGRPWLEVAIRFAAHQPGVSAALVGSGDLGHVLGLADDVARGPLPAEQVRRYRERFAALGASWPGLT